VKFARFRFSEKFHEQIEIVAGDLLVLSRKREGEGFPHKTTAALTPFLYNRGNIMNDTNQDNTDVTPPGEEYIDQTDTKREHETHWTALILLVTATLLIVVVILAYGDATTNPPTQPTATTTQQDTVTTKQMDTTDDLPEGLLIDQNATTTENKRVTRNGTPQRVIIQTTEQTKDDVFSYYRQWLNSSGLTEVNASIEDGFLLAEGDNGRTVSIRVDDTPERDHLLVRVNWFPGS